MPKWLQERSKVLPRIEKLEALAAELADREPVPPVGAPPVLADEVEEIEAALELMRLLTALLKRRVEGLG